MREIGKKDDLEIRGISAERGFQDIQYEIWTTFMRKTGDQLRNKEFRLIAQSSKLIDTYQNSKSLLKELDSTDDASSTKNTVISRDSFTRSTSPDERMFFRKSPRSPGKSISFLFADEMKDIEENCRPDTIKAMSFLVKEYQKLKNSSIDSQTSEKRLLRKVESLQRDHEHLLILKKINQETEKNLKKMQIENQQLKLKNKKLYEKIDKLKEQLGGSAGINTVGIVNIANFLKEKQKNINIKVQSEVNQINKVQNMENNILDAIGAQVKDVGCDKCCSFLRKIKDSILRLRRSLLEESQQIQQIYTRYKAVFIPGQY